MPAESSAKIAKNLNGYKKLPCILREKLYWRTGNGTYGHKKTEYRCTPTFVNLKSNTMKNHIAKVRTFSTFARVSGHKMCICNTYYILCLWYYIFFKNLRRVAET